MAAKSFLRLVNGVITATPATVTSAGAANDGDLVALDSSGKLDASVLPTGIEFSESDYQKVLNASDRERFFFWLDFGTKNERISSIIYSSLSVGFSFIKTFNYSLVGNSYQLDNETISQS